MCIPCLWLRQWWLLGCNIPCGFLPCQEVDVAVICYLDLALRVPDVGCGSAISLPQCTGYPHETVPAAEMHCSRNKRASLPLEALGWWAKEHCTEKTSGFIPAMFEVLLLSTSQPPEWRFPKLDFDLEEGLNRTGERGICRHELGPTNFMFLSVFYLLSVEMWPVWRVMLPFHMPQEKIVFLLISYKTDFHIAGFPFN